MVIKSQINDIDTRILEDWSKDEKFKLFQAFKLYGSTNIKKIKENVPSKSHDKIKEAISFYKAKALKSVFIKNKKRLLKRRQLKTNTPLVFWAKKLTDKISLKDLQTETDMALEILMQQEELTSECINFKDLYQQVINALRGKPLELDHLQVAVLTRMFYECSLVNKGLLKNISLDKVVELANFVDKEIISCPINSLDYELNNIRSIFMQRKFNPLALSEDMLKFEAKLLVKLEKEEKVD